MMKKPKKSISVNKKARGRPKKAGGVYPVSAVRLPPETVAAVDKWADRMAIGRGEAIRRLIELGLRGFSLRRLVELGQ